MAKRRNKRLFPKSFSSSFIPTSRIDHFKASAYNSQRSKATTGSRGNTEHKLDNSFMEDIPPTLETRRWDSVKKAYVHVPNYKMEVNKTKHALQIIESKDLFSLYRVWQGQNHQGVHKYYCAVLEQGHNYKCMLFFSGTEHLLVLESDDTRMISRTYSSREEVIQRKLSNTVSWIVTESISQSRG